MKGGDGEEPGKWGKEEEQEKRRAEKDGRGRNEVKNGQGLGCKNSPRLCPHFRLLMIDATTSRGKDERMCGGFRTRGEWDTHAVRV